MEKFNNSQTTQSQDSTCTPCKAKQKKLSILVPVNQFRQSDPEWIRQSFTSLTEVLIDKAKFTKIQVNTIIESIKSTPVQEQLIFVGAESDAIEIYNSLINLGIEPKVSGNSIQKF